MTQAEWLSLLCADAWRTELQAPGRFHEWIVATNGTAMVAVMGAPEDMPNHPSALSVGMLPIREPWPAEDEDADVSSIHEVAS